MMDGSLDASSASVLSRTAPVASSTVTALFCGLASQQRTPSGARACDTPAMVPPVPAASTTASSRPPLCRHSSGPVAARWAAALARLSTWHTKRAPRSAARAAARL